MAQETDANMDEVVDNLLRALQKMPVHEGISFRGGTVEDTFGGQAGTVVTSGLTATSRNARIATENFTTPAVYAVLGNQGRALEGVSQHPEEEEVVFLPGTLFQPVKQVRHGALLVTVVEQLDLERTPEDPKADLDTVLASIASTVRDDLALGQIEISSPGKFVGDIV
jgi:hypothetical protein